MEQKYKDIYDYLCIRLQTLEEEKNCFEEKNKKFNLQLEEIKTKIMETELKIDLKYEIFSPKPKNQGYSKTDLAVLSQKQIDVFKLLEENNEKLKKMLEEINIINNCIDNLK